ncbi:unnamed protein product [Chrysoparadoxa australica]
MVSCAEAFTASALRLPVMRGGTCREAGVSTSRWSREGEIAGVTTFGMRESKSKCRFGGWVCRFQVI